MAYTNVMNHGIDDMLVLNCKRIRRSNKTYTMYREKNSTEHFSVLFVPEKNILILIIIIYVMTQLQKKKKYVNVFRKKKTKFSRYKIRKYYKNVPVLKLRLQIVANE